MDPSIHHRLGETGSAQNFSHLETARRRDLPSATWIQELSKRFDRILGRKLLVWEEESCSRIFNSGIGSYDFVEECSEGVSLLAACLDLHLERIADRSRPRKSSGNSYRCW